MNKTTLLVTNFFTYQFCNPFLIDLIIKKQPYKTLNQVFRDKSSVIQNR